MKYGTTIIGIAIFDIIIMFSGLPYGWKKGILVVSFLVLIFVGWILRTLYLRKAKRIAERARHVEQSMERDIDRVVNQVARDVEREIDEIQGQQ